MYTAAHSPSRPFALKPLAAAVLLVCASTSLQSAPVFDSSPDNSVTLLPGNPNTPNTTTYKQEVNASNVGQANWTTFTIVDGETVKFVQPNANSVILNRVLGGQESQILGNLDANGRVFLINPSGIVFGDSAVVNVGGLVASTLDGVMSNGVFEFAGNSQEPIINSGIINAREIAFIAKNIKNNLTLNATNAGNAQAAVHLISAKKVTANTNTDNIVFNVTEGFESALIEQLKEVLVEGGRIVLIAHSNTAGQSHVINTAGTNQADQIEIQGGTVKLTGKFNESNPSGSLVVQAGEITQNASLTVGGSSQFEAGTVILNNTGNDFVGTVDLVNTGAINLADANNITVKGQAGALTISAPSVVQNQGVVTLDGLTANNLNVTARSVGQTGAVVVNSTNPNATTLTASTVNLNNAGNDFKGQVNLAVSGASTLKDANTLTVAGSTQSATLESASLAINGLGVTGDTVLKAGAITQNGALTVQGTTSLEGDSVALGNSANSFGDMVNLAVTGNANLNATGDLNVTGSAASVSAKASNTLSVSTLSAQNIVLDAAQVQLQNFSTQGSLELKGGNVTQQGALSVGGQTTLSANNVSLQNAGNDFQSEVVLASAGDVKLRDANSMSVQGQAQKLTVQAATSVEQTNALTVTGTSNITAPTISLNHADNAFGGVVTVSATQASLNAKENLAVGGTAANMTATAGETLSFATTTVDTLNATADQINQTGVLLVQDQASLTGRNVNLNNTQNDFTNAVNLSVTGQAQLADKNNLLVQGTSQALNTNVTGTLTAGALQVNSGNLLASAIELGQLNAQGAVRLQADTVTQAVANLSTGKLTIAADTVTLNNVGNDFQGEIVLENVGTAKLHDMNQLTLGGKANTLTVQAESINQTGSLTVNGQSTLIADNVDLRNQNNDFKGVVDLQVTGQAQLRDTNNLLVQGSASNLNVRADDILTLGAVQANFLTAQANLIEQNADLNVTGDLALTANQTNLSRENNSFQGKVILNGGNTTIRTADDLTLQGQAAALNATAKNIAQSEILTVAGPSALQAESIQLANTGNDFGGTVTVNSSGAVHIQDKNDLSLSGQTRQLNAGATNTLVLQNVSAESITAQANRIELSQVSSIGNTSLKASSINQNQQIQVGGETNIEATTVALNNANNDFNGAVNLTVNGQVGIRDANTLTLGAVNGSGSLDLKAGNVEQSAALLHSGTVQVQADTVTLDQAGNDFSGQLLIKADTADVVDSNTLNMEFEGQTLSVQASTLNATNVNASGDVTVNADSASLTSARDLSLQGQVGTLNVRADRFTQNAALAVSNGATITASEVELNNQNNDFQGDVKLNVSGDVRLRDANALAVSGQANGNVQLAAQSISQIDALAVQGDLLLQAGQVDLTQAGNNLTGVVRVEGAPVAALRSQGQLTVEGVNLSQLALTADQISLGSLGTLQQLDLNADRVQQTAALAVSDTTTLVANRIELDNAANDFIGLVSIQPNGSAASVVSLADINTLNVEGGNLQLKAQVQGDLNLKANDVLFNASSVAGNTDIELSGALTQNGAVDLKNASLKAEKIKLTHAANQFDGNTQVDSTQLIEIRTAGDLNLNTGSSTGPLALNTAGNANVTGAQLVFGESAVAGDLIATGNQISQTGALRVQGKAEFEAFGGSVNLQNSNNDFAQTVSISADQTSLAARGDVRLQNLMSRGGQITAGGKLLLLGNIEQNGGSLTFTAKGISAPLSSAEIALLLPPALDVYSSKEAVDPVTGLGRITLGSASIHQQSGQIVTASGSTTQFNTSANSSIVLTKNNQINGQVGALAGQNYGQAYSYNTAQGASLIAINNDVQLRVGGNGFDADVVGIRSRGLATQGANSVIRARMPYNDFTVGTANSYAGLTLSIPLSNLSGSQAGVTPFGESSAGGQSGASGAIRVEVGDLNRPGFGGFLTVLPFEGSNLLPGQVVYLAGPVQRNTYAFFYDGARNLGRVPVVYNGSLLLSPQETAALTTAQGAVVLARQEQTRSVVRTENVAGKIINGVVIEVGPGRPATEGTGGAGKPESCDAADEDLNCSSSEVL